MRFRHNWDEYLIQQCQQIIQQTGHDKVMLTTYPLGYTLPNNIPKQETRGTYLIMRGSSSRSSKLGSMNSNFPTILVLLLNYVSLIIFALYWVHQKQGGEQQQQIQQWHIAILECCFQSE
jgi:hypothetical protein